MTIVKNKHFYHSDFAMLKFLSWRFAYWENCILPKLAELQADSTSSSEGFQYWQRDMGGESAKPHDQVGEDESKEPTQSLEVANLHNFPSSDVWLNALEAVTPWNFCNFNEPADSSWVQQACCPKSTPKGKHAYWNSAKEHLRWMFVSSNVDKTILPTLTYQCIPLPVPSQVYGQFDSEVGVMWNWSRRTAKDRFHKGCLTRGH